MSELAVDVRELRKDFSIGLRARKRTALDGMTLSVAPGEIYGFLGPNGAGKTTTIKVLTSLLRPDSGEARLFGQAPFTPGARRRLGFLPESPVFYDHLTGREFLSLCGSLAGMSGAKLRQRVEAELERVGLGHAANLQVRRYSKGMTQRLGIAQAILHDPDLVILDEPMSGLDPIGRGDVRQIILDLRKQGKTVFFSTHIIPDVAVICDRVGVVSRGKIIRVGTVAELLREGASAATEVVAQNLPAAFKSAAAAGEAVGSQVCFVADGQEKLRQLVQEIVGAGGTLVSVTPRQASLEDLVVRMLAGGNAS